MDATVYLNYAQVTSDNLTKLLMDGQRLSTHIIKWLTLLCTFLEQGERTSNDVWSWGKCCIKWCTCDTDSTSHFLTASLYLFYSKPNYDSIYPAIDYVKKDMVNTRVAGVEEISRQTFYCSGLNIVYAWLLNAVIGIISFYLKTITFTHRHSS
jgi:hypothetical protein